MTLPSITRDIAKRLPGVVFSFRLFDDGKWERLWISDGLDELLGERTAASVEKAVTELRARIHPEDLTSFERASRRANADGAAFDCEARVRCDSGWRWIHAVARGTALDDDSVVWHGLLLDVDARRRAEDELRKLEATIRDGQRLESLGVLAGGIAHEFNNQLQVILGNVGVALDGLGDSGPRAEALQAARDAGLRASELCRRLLDYTGQAPPITGPIDVNALVREMARLFQVSVPRDAVLQLDLTSDARCVDADAAQLRQVILNLVTNAAEALVDVGPPRRLSVRTHEVRGPVNDADLLPGPPAGDALVRIDVEDTGHGFTDEALARAFDPFFTTRAPGRGMGLASTLGILRAHNGAIRIERLEPRGSRVEVYLPACAAPKPASSPAAVAAPGRGGRVLVVDDEESVRRVCERILTARGFEVVPAASGAEAIRRAQETPSFDLAIIDLTMPRLDGHGTLDGLRAHLPALPVVLISGYDSSRLAGRKLDETTRFLPKPFLPEDLVDVVRRALAASAAGGA